MEIKEDKTSVIIRVNKPTWRKLNILKDEGKTFDNVINELLEKGGC